MPLRAAAVAFAASAFLIAPAAAEPVAGAIAKLETQLSDSTRLSVQIGSSGTLIHNAHHRSYRGNRSNQGYRSNGRYRLNAFGQTAREQQSLANEALRACNRAANRRATRIGFRDVDNSRRNDRARQFAPLGFQVRLNRVEFEGRRRDFVSDVTCTVRRGRVVELSGIPEPGRSGRRHAGYRGY